MRCAACKAAALQALPANLFSRRPGYVCSACGALMRSPGSATTCVIAIVLGTFVFLLGIGLALIAIDAGTVYAGRLGGAVLLAALGVLAPAWGILQLRRPIPLDVPARPSRLLFTIVLFLVVLLVGLLVIGGGLFAFMYYLQEMM